MPTAQRLGQAIAGEMSADDALKRLAPDIDEQVKAAGEVASGARSGRDAPPHRNDASRDPLHRLAAAVAAVCASRCALEAPFRCARCSGSRRAARSPGCSSRRTSLILGLFTFLPIVINFYYAFTGGVAALSVASARSSARENLATLFDCDELLRSVDVPQGPVLARDLQHREVRGAAGRR